MVHFHKELLSQFEEYYKGSNSCLECGKRFDKLTPWNASCAKKKHLVFNHSNHAKVILNLVTEHLNKIGEKKDVLDGKSTAKDLIMKEKKREKLSFFCSKCDRGWPSSSRIKKLVRKHMTSHKRDDFIHHLAGSFNSNNCLKCEKIVQTESEQRLHLFEKHGIFFSQINMQVEKILSNGNKAKQK